MRHARLSRKVDKDVVSSKMLSLSECSPLDDFASSLIGHFFFLFASPEFDFPVKDHTELGERLGIIDFR